MKAFIVQFPFGVAAFDEKNSLIEKALFPKKPQAAAKSLLRAESGKLSDQTTSLITLLKNAGYDTFVFSNAKLAEEAQKKLDVTVEVATPAQAAVHSAKMSEVALESGSPQPAGTRHMEPQRQHGTLQATHQRRHRQTRPHNLAGHTNP
jgi:hypothetical protein